MSFPVCAHPGDSPSGSPGSSAGILPDGSVAMTGPFSLGTVGQINSSTAADATALIVNATIARSTGLLVDLRDNNASKFTVNKNGHIKILGGNGAYNAGLDGNWLYIKSNAGGLRLMSGNQYLHWQNNRLAPIPLYGMTIGGGTHFADQLIAEVSLRGIGAASNATNNLQGGSVTLGGADGASGSSGAAHGGHTTITTGIGYGTGKHGIIKLDHLARAAITASDLIANQAAWWVDQVNHNLHFRIKYSDGTTSKTAAIALT